VPRRSGCVVPVASHSRLSTESVFGPSTAAGKWVGGVVAVARNEIVGLAVGGAGASRPLHAVAGKACGARARSRLSPPVRCRGELRPNEMERPERRPRSMKPLESERKLLGMNGAA
jgi:hypothetical protein